ncbi:hypothetical protein [Thermococcus thermotolerans]|uniref:hypothetical protein n=1 Tax=Thermococcus thermotolerans TaxID=2969672 RepID=UPI002158131A|nr:hypothetical protein [Thermococcus thermotolerans]
MYIVTGFTPSQSFKFSKKRIYISNEAGYIIINKESDLKNKVSFPQEIPVEIKVGGDKIKLITKVLENKYNYRIYLPVSIMRTLIRIYKLKEPLTADVELEFEFNSVLAKINFSNFYPKHSVILCYVKVKEVMNHDG